MDIQSAISSISSLVNAGTQVSQTQQVQAAGGSEAQPEARAEATQEVPRPVKNAQGQVTGRLVNETA